ncbi:MAG: hypothetical protein K0V04_19595 [Deltaproteobacteria bacterium]|nr:hypothetical protein [Deltaproteobacteria bacterium]
MTDHVEEKHEGRPLSFISDSILDRARRLGAAGRHQAAANEYQVLVDIDPGDLYSGLKLAHHLVSAGRYARAADEYLRLAVVYARLGQERRALIVASRGLQLDSSRAVRRRLDPLVRRLGSRATSLCEQAARMHLLGQRNEEARHLLRLLVEHDPSALARRLRLAELDLAQGRTEEGLAELRIAADGLRTHGRTAELVRVLEMMLVHGGPAEPPLRELSTIYIRCGQSRRALEKLEVLHRIAPHDRTALERLARVHASLGQLELTLRELERLARLVAEHGDRGQLRELIARATAWCSDASYQRAIEDLGLRVLRPAAPKPNARTRRGKAGSRRSPRRGAPPPLPGWGRRDVTGRIESGEIDVD